MKRFTRVCIGILLLSSVFALWILFQTRHSRASGATFPVLLAKSAWPKFAGDTRNSGRGGVYRANGTKKWEFTLSSPNPMEPAIGADGTLYIGCGVINPDLGDCGGYLYAIDSNTGKAKWRFDPGDAVLCTPALGSDGTVYFGCQNGNFYALEGRTGEVRWEFHTHTSIYSSPTLGSDNTVYFGATEGVLYALNATTGELKWKYESGIAVTSCPALGADGVIYISSVQHDSNSKIVAVDSKTGHKKWEYVTDATILDSPVLGPENTLYVTGYRDCSFLVDGKTGRQCKLFALDAKAGEQKWTFTHKLVDITAPANNSMAVGDGNSVYVTSPTNELIALDAHTGHIRWTFANGLSFAGIPLVGSEGTIYIGCRNRQRENYLIALDGETGKQRDKFPTNDTTVILIDKSNSAYGVSDASKICVLR